MPPRTVRSPPAEALRRAPGQPRGRRGVAERARPAYTRARRRGPAGPGAAPRRPSRRRSVAAGGSRLDLARRARKVLFLVVFVLFTGLAGTAYALSRLSLPPAIPQAQTTTLVDANDKPLAQLSGGQNRQPVGIDQVPPVVVDAVVATEDRAFYHHHGVDPVGIVRAFVADLRGRGSLQGASTLTQQYVKNAYLGQQRTLSRKAREAVLSLKLERQLTKRQILERYLNTIYFGRGAYGIEAASEAYFAKPVGQLGLSEASFLAGAIRAPELADPSRSPRTATARRDRSLLAMVATHRITQAQAEPLLGQPVVAGPYVPADQKVLADPNAHAEYYVSYVTQRLIRTYGEKVVYGGGLTVKTSLDLDMQRKAYGAVYGDLTAVDGPAGGLVSVDNSGAVKAMVGGRDYASSKVNLAVGSEGGGAGRQPGSTMKAVLLAEIAHERYSVLSSFRAPAQILLPHANNGQDWRVSNFDNEDYSGPDGTGTLNLIDATRDSVNTVYAQAVASIGPTNMARMGDAMGLGPNLPGYASLVLGTVDQSVLQMAGAYSVFADGGSYIEPHTILEVHDRFGAAVSFPRPSRSDGVLTKEQADIVTHCLRQVVLNGTGQLAAFGHQVAGKTGTTESNTDAWFVGYTPQPGLTTAVWMGYPTRSQPMVGIYGVKAVTGGTVPADIFRRFMAAALVGQTNPNGFDEPPSFPGKTLGPPRTAVFVPSATTTTVSTTTTAVPSSTTTVAPASTTLPGGSTLPGVSTTAPGQPTTTLARRPPSTTVAPATTSPPTTVGKGRGSGG